MKSIRRKADLLEKEFDRRDLNGIFKRNDYEDTQDVLFHGKQKMGNGICNIYIGLDDSIFNQAQYVITNLDNENKRNEILNLLNELNINYKTIHFYINKDNNIMGQILYASDNDDFNANLFCSMITNHYTLILENEFPEIMKVMWG